MYWIVEVGIRAFSMLRTGVAIRSVEHLPVLTLYQPD